MLDNVDILSSKNNILLNSIILYFSVEDGRIEFTISHGILPIYKM